MGSTVYLAAQWLITVLVVRLSTGYDAAGLLALGMSVSNIFSPVGYYKVRAFQVSDLDREYSFNEYLGFRVVTVFFSFAIMVVYIFFTCPEHTWVPVFLYGVYSFGPIFVDVIHGEDQLCSRMDYVGLSLAFRGILSLVAFVVGMELFHSLNISLVLMIAVTFAVILMFDGYAVKRVGVTSLLPHIELKTTRRLLIRLLPLVVALFFCSAVPALPRQLLNDLAGSSALGIYGSVASPILIVQMCAQFIYSPLLTSFAERYKARQARRFLNLVGFVSLFMAAIALVLGAFLAFFGEPIFVFLYGESIAAYTYLIIPLVICTVLVAYVWFLGDLLIVMRKNMGNLVGYLISFIIMLATMYPLISFYDMNGVSFTVIVSFGAGLVFFLITIFLSLHKHVKEKNEQTAF